MHDLLVNIFGEGKDLSTLQMMARTAAMFVIALVLLRIGGVRILGKKSAFDEIIAIMLGAVLSRGIVGASSFLSVSAAGGVMVLLHRITAILTRKNLSAAKWAKGRPVILYENGQYDERHLANCCVSREEVMESLRLQTNNDDMSNVEKVYLEGNGRISFVLREG